MGQVTITFELPYNFEASDLIITDPVQGKSMDEGMGWISDNIPWNDEEVMGRIFLCTVLLSSTTDRPLGECLAQALIWECG